MDGSSEDYEFVHVRPNADCEDSENDDVLSFGGSIISLDSDGEPDLPGSALDSQAASAVIAALEDASRPIDHLQDLIHEAMASIHVPRASTEAGLEAAPAVHTVEAAAEAAAEENAAPSDTPGSSSDPLDSAATQGDAQEVNKLPKDVATSPDCSSGSCKDVQTVPIDGVSWTSPPAPAGNDLQPHSTYNDDGCPHVGAAAPTIDQPSGAVASAAAHQRNSPALTRSAVLVVLLGACTAAVTTLLMLGGAGQLVQQSSQQQLAYPSQQLGLSFAGFNASSTMQRTPANSQHAYGDNENAVVSDVADQLFDHSERRYCTGSVNAFTNVSTRPVAATSHTNGTVPTTCAAATLALPWDCGAAASAAAAVAAISRTSTAANGNASTLAAINLLMSCPQQWSCRSDWLKAGANFATAGAKRHSLAAPVSRTAANTTLAAAFCARIASAVPSYAKKASLVRSLCGAGGAPYMWASHTGHWRGSRRTAQQQQRGLLQLLQLPQGSYSKQLAIPFAAVAVYSAAAKLQHKKHGATVATNSTLFNSCNNSSSKTPTSNADALPRTTMADRDTSAAAVRGMVTQPTKPVPPLYRPAPPCMMIVPQHSKQGFRFRGSDQGLVPDDGAKTHSGGVNFTRATAGGGVGALKRLMYRAASSIAAGLTLPMLPPFAYPQPPAAAQQGNRSTGSSSSNNGAVSMSQAAAAVAAATGGGLTLPMLPPVNQPGHMSGGGGLTLPMLPPITCMSCGKHLQLLQPHSSKRVASMPSLRLQGSVGVNTKPSVLGIAPANDPPTCPVTTTCTAQQQYDALRNQQQQQHQQQGYDGSSGHAGLVVGTFPSVTAATAAAAVTASSTNNAADMMKQQLGLGVVRPEYEDAASAPRSSVANATFQSRPISAKTNSSVGVGADGRWVGSWVSFPMLLAAEAPHKQPKLHSHAAATRPSPQVPTGAAVKPVAAAKPVWAEIQFKTGNKRSRVQELAAEPATAALPAAAAAGPSSSTFHALAIKVNRQTVKLQQPTQKLMQLIDTARMRSLQCSFAGPDGQAGLHGRFLARPGSKPGGSYAYAANNAAYSAARQLVASTKHLQHASAAGAPAQQMRELCADVGYAHRDLQARLAAAVFKSTAATDSTHAPKSSAVLSGAGSSSAAALQTTAPAEISPPLAGSRPAAAIQGSSFAPGSAARKGSRAGGTAIPLGPAGVMQPASHQPRFSDYLANRGVAPGHAANPALAASGPYEGPLLPLQQQLAEASRRTSPRFNNPAAAAALPAGVEIASKAAAAALLSSGRSSSTKAVMTGAGGGNNVWVLNAGWDHKSALAAAKVAAAVSRAEGELQRTCRQLAAYWV